MYDLIDIIESKLSDRDYLINKWMTNNHLIQSTLINDIKSIRNTINNYHKKYVICEDYSTNRHCKYGAHCWYLHPIGDASNSVENNISSDLAECKDDENNSIVNDETIDDLWSLKRTRNQRRKQRMKKRKKRKWTKKQMNQQRIESEIKQTNQYFNNINAKNSIMEDCDLLTKWTYDSNFNHNVNYSHLEKAIDSYEKNSNPIIPIETLSDINNSAILIARKPAIADGNASLINIHDKQHCIDEIKKMAQSNKRVLLFLDAKFLASNEKT